MSIKPTKLYKYEFIKIFDNSNKQNKYLTTIMICGEVRLLKEESITNMAHATSKTPFNRVKISCL